MSLGVWEYQGNRPTFPAAAGSCEAIVAHGDLDNSGTCSMRIFRTGEAVGGLGSGTFRLVKITAPPEQIEPIALDIRKQACGY